jgi:hypothetical protein
MLNWEEELSAPMRLTAVDISDIKEKHPFKPKLQRYVIPIALNNYNTPNSLGLEGIHISEILALLKVTLYCCV